MFDFIRFLLRLKYKACVNVRVFDCEHNIIISVFTIQQTITHVCRRINNYFVMFYTRQPVVFFATDLLEIVGRVTTPQSHTLLTPEIIVIIYNSISIFTNNQKGATKL